MKLNKLFAQILFLITFIYLYMKWIDLDCNSFVRIYKNINNNVPLISRSFEFDFSDN